MTKPYSEHFLNLISDDHPGLVAYINKNCRHEYASEGFEKITSRNFAMEECFQRSFERFERASRTPKLSGLGLGLFISREIVESYRGRNWVEGEIDRESTFFVILHLGESK